MRQGNSVVSTLWFLLKLTLLFATILLVLAPREVQAQLETASVNGTVRDATGAVVPDATVSLRNLATNVEHATATNDAGNYAFVNISPGRYKLTVTKQGFSTATKPELDLAVNQTSTIDLSLHVGSASETVTVEAIATSLQTSSAELGAVISGRSVANLPLNGRNFTQLLNGTPGVSTVNTAQNATNQQFAGNTVGSFSFPSINGQTNRSNLYLLDGLNNQESFASTYSVPPIIDDIQEFKVDSHNDQAQFGGVLGGVVNVATKSGTNEFHGAAWEFFRNSALDAKNPITGINQLHLNQFGANIGGPVFLPRYNGRNRTFFFGSYEGVRRREGNANLVFIPTPAHLNGDFTLDPQGNALAQIYNPYSTASPSGVRQPFRCIGSTPAPLIAGTRLQDQTVGAPCNILPSGLIDPNMQAIARLLYGPLTPNVTGTRGNFQKALTNTQSPDSYNIRVDEQLSQKDAFWGRFSHIYSPRNVPGIFGQSNLNEYWAHQWGITWNHTFGPSSVLSIQFGRNRGYSTNPVLLPENFSQQLIQAGGYDKSFACGYTLGPRSCYFNGVNFSDGNFSGSSAASEGTSPAIVADIWQWKGNFNKILGRHILSMGGEFNTNGFQQIFNQNTLNFSANQTASATSSGRGGYSVASFLLGIPSGDTYRNQFETEHGGWVDGFYFQDQWKITNRLTMNLGARYDVTFVPIYGSAADNNVPVGNLDLGSGNYVLQSTAPSCASTGNKPPCIPAPTGALPGHVVVSPDGRFWQNSYDNIQPRVGLAYRLTNRTVIRSSFGRFFDNWAAVIQMAQNQQGTWPRTDQLIVALNQNPGPPTVFAENPLQGANTVPAPTPFEQNNWFVDPNLKNPYSYQWNFGVQEAVTANTTLTVNYVGSRGHRLDVNVNGNLAKNPGPGVLPTAGPSGCLRNPGCQAQLVGRFPLPYSVVTHYDESVGKSWYDALQVSFDRKASSGLSYLVSYTWSKTMSLGSDEWFSAGTNGTSIQNPYNLAAEKALAGFDLPHIFTAHVVYELPFGSGRRFQTGVRPLDFVIGGWQVNGIANLASGTLFNVVASNAIPNNGAVNGNSERANLLGDPRSGTCPNGSPVGTLNCWFNTSAFAIPSQYTFGNFGRNVLRSDGRANFDTSVFRGFRITEAKRLEFRAEAFNLTNSPIWGTPNANISTSGALFGVVNSMAPGYAPRQLQLALKFYY